MRASVNAGLILACINTDCAYCASAIQIASVDWTFTFQGQKELAQTSDLGRDFCHFTRRLSE